MKTFKVEAAQPIGTDDPSEAHILIARDTWRATYSTVELLAKFDNDAHVLAEALFGSLPGGTLDRLLAIMLKRKASSLVVSYPDPDVLK